VREKIKKYARTFSFANEDPSRWPSLETKRKFRESEVGTVIVDAVQPCAFKEHINLQVELEMTRVIRGMGVRHVGIKWCRTQSW